MLKEIFDGMMRCCGARGVAAARDKPVVTVMIPIVVHAVKMPDKGCCASEDD